MHSSSISGFYELPGKERLARLKDFGLSAEDLKLFEGAGALDFETANRMVENCIGTFQLPLGIATNFLINGKDVLVPMAIEEPSVVAAASHAAKLCRETGGFTATSTEPVMIGQIQVLGIPESGLEKAVEDVRNAKAGLIEKANSVDSTIVKLGGGAKDVKPGIIETASGKILVIHLLVDVRDAMGANAVNGMCESVAPEIEKITGGKVLLKILSNLSVYRKAEAKAVWTKEALEASTKGELKGEEVVDRIVKAFEFADGCNFRAATHNKGIMNGVDAVVIATGNDWRAVEAGAHAYAAKTGSYRSLSKYYKNENGDLVGEIKLPLAVGLVGGATKTHPLAKACVKLLGVKTARELSEIIACVGLAQNFAALRALATEGIQRGHMRLHAKNIAVLAGAVGKEIDVVAEEMHRQGSVGADNAKRILEGLKAKRARASGKLPAKKPKNPRAKSSGKANAKKSVKAKKKR
ncbi:MAG: hydroxymethylglutaryl-CoA reductase, degradative [Candidatus Diapherotrites archaeon]|nr:hydroxymethylglutaryl-CoA reductase, degradative [Candidatus Diapherotrites archaeon]